MPQVRGGSGDGGQERPDEADPPNAAVVTQTADGEDVLVVELLNPRLDAAAGTLTYDARPLAEYVGEMLTGLSLRQADLELPAPKEAGSLFIDAKKTKRRGSGLSCPSIPVVRKGAAASTWDRSAATTGAARASLTSTASRATPRSNS